MIEIKSLFQNTVATYRPARQAELLAAVRLFCRTYPRDTKEFKPHSTKIGFQSASDIFDLEDPAIKMLKSEIAAFAGSFMNTHFKFLTSRNEAPAAFSLSLWGWFTEYDERGWNSPHMHPRSLVSGVYFVNTPAEILDEANRNFSGWLGFEDPRPAAQNWPVPGQLTEVFFPPVEGTFIMFPSFIRHYVPPFRGGGVRTTVAFNLRHDPAGNT